MGEPSATDLYSLTYVKRPRWRTWLALMVNFISTTMLTNGSGHAVFRRRDTGELVAEFKEPFINSSMNEYNEIITDYWTKTAEDFERTWVAD